MSAADHLGLYAEGWTTGDAEKITKAAAETFVFDDPNAGKITKSDFARYLGDVKEAAKSARGGDLPDPFMQLSEVVTNEDAGVLTAWCWWSVEGTPMLGSGLIKVDDTGVLSEVITYYSKLPG